MKRVEILFKTNGYVVISGGFIKNNGEHVYKQTEEKALLEFLGLLLLEKKIEVTEK